MKKSLRATKAYKKMTRYMACAIAEGFCEGEGAGQIEKLAAWQYLIDTHLCWSLQGWYGRTASNLIENGVLAPAKA